MTDKQRVDVQQLELFHQDTLDIESWLRRKAEEWARKDPRLAARLDRGADLVEQAGNRIRERISQNISEDERD